MSNVNWAEVYEVLAWAEAIISDESQDFTAIRPYEYEAVEAVQQALGKVLLLTARNIFPPTP